MKYEVKTPVPGYVGMRAGMQFASGATIVDDSEPRQAKALRWFERKGYTITKLAEDAEASDVEVGDGAEAVATGEEDATSTETSVVDSDAAEAGQVDVDPSKRGVLTPSKSSSKATWVSWAVSHGDMTSEDANALTRDQLAAKFTEEA